MVLVSSSSQPSSRNSTSPSRSVRVGSALVVELGVAAPDVVAALAVAVLAATPAGHLDHHPAAPVAVAHLRADVPPIAVLGDLPAGILRPLDVPTIAVPVVPAAVVPVLERGPLVAEVVRAVALAILAVAPAAHRHRHPAAVLVAVAGVDAHVPPVAVLRHLAAGVARPLDVPVADPVAGLRRREADQPG